MVLHGACPRSHAQDRPAERSRVTSAIKLRNMDELLVCGVLEPDVAQLVRVAVEDRCRLAPVRGDPTIAGTRSHVVEAMERQDTLGAVCFPHDRITDVVELCGMVEVRGGEIRARILG